jgi:hypothetical protein
MSDDPPSEVLGSLPRTRPHRRSDKRASAKPPNKPPAADQAPAADAADAAPAANAADQAPAADAADLAPAANAADVAPAATAATKPVGAISRPAAQPRTAAKPKRRPTGNSKPRSRPASADRLRQPAQPAGAPPGPRSRKPVPATGADILGTAVQAAAELAEIGLSAGARALRSALSRLPKP